MERSDRFSGYLAIATLFVLSPVIAELLGGSTPVSRANQLILEALFYGPGALLIREFARRNSLGWFSILLLGLAFGITEECLSTQSVFNPDFLGNDLTFGRLWGVNWPWATVIIIYHAVWSITIPIIFAELLFPARMHRPWLNIYGITGFSVLFLLSGSGIFAIFIKMEAFRASWIHFLVAAALVLILIFSARSRLLRNMVLFSIRTPGCFLAGLISFLAGILSFVLETSVFTKGFGLPPLVIPVLALILFSGFIILASGWANDHLDNRHLYALASGGLLANLLFGLSVLLNFKNTLDIISQLCFIVAVTMLVFFFFRKVKA